MMTKTIVFIALALSVLFVATGIWQLSSFLGGATVAVLVWCVLDED
jgi:hypothetical protein